MDKPANARCQRRFDHGQRPFDIPDLEAFGIGRVHHTGHVNDRLRAIDDPHQRPPISQIAAYPVHALPIGLGSPGQGVGRHMACLRRIKNRLSHKTGRAGQSYCHSNTN